MVNRGKSLARGVEGPEASDNSDSSEDFLRVKKKVTVSVKNFK